MLGRWSGLDLDRVAHGRPILASILIDSIGSGTLLPFIPLYFVYRAGLSAAEVGALLTIAAVGALPSATVAGLAVSRFGASRTIQVVNYGRAIAAVLALFSVTRELALIAMFLSTVGDNSFWSSNATFVADISGDQRRAWYALERSARNAAMGLGALTAGIVVSTVGDRGLLWFMALNGASFVLAAILLRPVRTPTRPARSTEAKPRAVRAFFDLRFDAFLMATVLLTLPMLAMPSVLTLTLNAHARWGASAAGLLIAGNVILIVVGQPAVTRRVERYRHKAMLQLACACAIAGSLAIAAGFALPVALTVLAAAAGMALLTGCELLCNATLNDLVVRVAPPDELPQYMSAYSLAWSLGGLLWPVSMLSLTESGPSPTWTVMAGCGLAAAVFVLAVPSMPAPSQQVLPEPAQPASP
jgi:MFS family permease